MGEVFRARDTRLNREVAIKVLPAAVAHDSERVARFRREAQILATLNQMIQRRKHLRLAREPREPLRIIRERRRKGRNTPSI